MCPLYLGDLVGRLEMDVLGRCSGRRRDCWEWIQTSNEEEYQ